jgi:hypothetical protein
VVLPKYSFNFIFSIRLLLSANNAWKASMANSIFGCRLSPKLGWLRSESGGGGNPRPDPAEARPSHAGPTRSPHHSGDQIFAVFFSLPPPSRCNFVETTFVLSVLEGYQYPSQTLFRFLSGQLLWLLPPEGSLTPSLSHSKEPTELGGEHGSHAAHARIWQTTLHQANPPR